MEKEKKRINLPVEIDDDGQFGIDEDRLDESLHRRIEELARERTYEKVSAIRMVVATILGFFLFGIISLLLLRGGFLLAAGIICAVLFNIGNITRWIENEEKP